MGRHQHDITWWSETQSPRSRLRLYCQEGVSKKPSEGEHKLTNLPTWLGHWSPSSGLIPPVSLQEILLLWRASIFLAPPPASPPQQTGFEQGDSVWLVAGRWETEGEGGLGNSPSYELLITPLGTNSSWFALGSLTFLNALIWSFAVSAALYIVQRQRSCLIHLCTLGAATLRTTEHSISSFLNGASQRMSVTFCLNVFTAIFPLVKMTPKDILWVQNKIICVPWNSNLPHRFFFFFFLQFWLLGSNKNSVCQFPKETGIRQHPYHSSFAWNRHQESPCLAKLSSAQGQAFKKSNSLALEIGNDKG